MRSKGFPFSLWGSGGLRVCSLDVAFCGRNRPQPFATVRKPFRVRDRMAVPMGSFYRGGPFLEVFRTSSLLRFAWAGVALRDIQDVFLQRVESPFLRGRRNTFATFSEDVLQFFVAGAALWDASIVIFSWQAQHFRRVPVACFFVNRIGRAASSGGQGANSVAGVAFSDMC